MTQLRQTPPPTPPLKGKGASDSPLPELGEGLGVRAGLGSPARHFIDGQFVESASGETFPTRNPANNQPIAEVASGDAQDIARAVAAAKKALPRWSRMPARERAKLLHRVADLIDQRVDEIGQTETLDVGIPISQTSRAQVPRAAENFRFFAEMALRMDGETYPVDDRQLNYTLRQPVGVAGLITLWNTPFMLETWKVAPCLATGNTCVLKPAELSPLSAQKLAEVIAEAGLPEGVFNLVNGVGERAGAALVRHPDVKLISFTGETVTGRTIMREGAETLKRYSMELGGKSPNLVFADADLDTALDSALFQIYSLNGERCTAGSRLLLQRPIYDAFVARFVERARRVRVGDPFDPHTELGPLISREHREKVVGYIELGQREGAELLVGGTDIPPGLSPEGNWVVATALGHCRNDMRVAQEEIFGPVLVIIPFDTDEEAVRLANDVPYGLAAYVWTQNLTRAHRVAAELEAGMVWINSHNIRELKAPFGGAKASGIGREGGHYSFEFYTELKNVCVTLAPFPVAKFGMSDRGDT